MNVYVRWFALLSVALGMVLPSAPALAAPMTAAAVVDFGEITETGPGVVVTVAEPDHTAEVHFTGTVGRRLSLGFTAVTLEGLYEVSVVRPDGTVQVNASPLIGINSELDLAALTQAGRHRVILDPFGTKTGSATITLSAEVAGGELSPTGPGGPASIERPGQNARFQFAGVVGQRFSLGFTAVTLEGLYEVSVFRPDGTVQVRAAPLIGINSELDLAALTQAGAYSVVIDPLRRAPAS